MPYKPGENYVACDRCGFKRLASECRMTWDGWLTCKDCYEDKHPALEAHPLSGDRILAKHIRMPIETFIEPPEVVP